MIDDGKCSYCHQRAPPLLAQTNGPANMIIDRVEVVWRTPDGPLVDIQAHHIGNGVYRLDLPRKIGIFTLRVRAFVGGQSVMNSFHEVARWPGQEDAVADLTLSCNL